MSLINGLILSGDWKALFAWKRWLPKDSATMLSIYLDRFQKKKIILRNMRFFGTIMAFWLLLLSCFPCSDKQKDCLPVSASISSTTDHDKHQQEIEHCTPFCVCSCCAVTTVSQEPVFYSFNRPLFGKTTYLAYETPVFSNISVAIWQPPRFC